METYKIQGVEIFSAGTWNGDEYSIDDLNGIIEAFNMHKDGVRPFLKLGHDDDQKLLQKDGFPAAGWVDRIYLVGEKLVADFVDIPKKIFELIQSKAYRKVSCEIFWNVKIKDMYHKQMLGAVALLGADTPGVMNLKDILGMYKKVFADNTDLKIYKDNALTFKQGAKMEKTEEQIKLEYTLKLEQDAKADLEAKYAEASKVGAALESENAELKAYKLEAEKKEAAQAIELEKVRIEKYVADLAAEKLCIPSMKPLLTQLIGAEKKEYSVTIGKEEKKFKSKEEILKEALKLFSAAKDVNFEESSSDGEKDSKVDEKAIDEKVRKYMSEHKCTYAAALKIVLKDKQ